MIASEIAKAYEESLKEHIAYVKEAGRRIGVPPEQLDFHDESKWKEPEFSGYALHFKGGGAPNEFATAWIHHIHHNPHHWQHWIFPDGYTPEGSNVENGIVRMPEKYALEMIADWMGASKAYTRSWDISEWLKANIPRVSVHSETAKYLREQLDLLGYANVVYMVNFKSELVEAKDK